MEGFRLSWESVSRGNWKSAGNVVFLLLALRADLLRVVAACEEKAKNVRLRPDTTTYRVHPTQSIILTTFLILLAYDICSLFAVIFNVIHHLIKYVKTKPKVQLEQCTFSRLL